MDWLSDIQLQFANLGMAGRATVVGTVITGMALIWAIYTPYAKPSMPAPSLSQDIENSQATTSDEGVAVVGTGNTTNVINLTNGLDRLAAKAFETLKEELENKEKELKSAELREKQYQEFIKALKEAIEAISKQTDIPNAEERIRRALLEATQGNTFLAETIFLEVERRKSAKGKAANKKAAEAALHRGALAFVHDPRKAWGAYHRAIELDPDNVEGWNRVKYLHLFHGAGNYAKGYGETPTEAIDNALKAAENIVAGREKGCVSGDTQYFGKEHGLYVFGAHYTHHFGSCSPNKANLEEAKKHLGSIKTE